MKMLILLLLLLLLLPLSAQARAESREDPATRPFRPGESLSYEIRLLGIETAKAELEVFDDRGGVLRVRAQARTTGAADGIFRMQSQATCSLEPSLDPGLCRGNLKSRRSTLRREVRFEKEEGVVAVRQMRNGKLKQSRIEFEPGLKEVHDTLSGLYLIRAKLPEVGQSIRFRGVVEGASGEVVAETLRTEMVETELGTFRTAVVEVKILGKHDEDTTTQAVLWITMDENRLPLKATTKAPIGSLEARLVAAKGVKAAGVLAQR